MIKKVLIVEDEMFNRLLLRDILEDINNNIDILEVSSIDGALEAISNDLDMVFLDLNLNNEDGEKLIDKIRDMNRKCKIIVTSGSDKIKELKERCDYYLLKPYVDEDIEDIVNKFII